MVVWSDATEQQDLGLARNVGSGALPLNGLRHPSSSGSTGWCLWAGDTLSDDADFFEPVHTGHLLRRAPQALPYLALPSGWRFLRAPDHTDVWRDDSLLDVG